ncbi:hypothetical protein C4577_00735 [Candidatus Parcubacteria bacterium]|nr:MAG: hypothetical protein C4577_00735 [Candidatus Parcubacteria bacterium]
MPRRNTIFANGEYYHIYNRALNKEPIFVKDHDRRRSILTLSYYRYSNPPTKLSYLLSFGYDKRKEILDNIQDSEKLVEIITYCLMPNHYHLLLRQLKENGISNYIKLFQNSFTRYFNTKNKRKHYLFEGQFKAVRVEDNEQFLHLHRYIHLNPYSSFIVKSISELEKYPYSSLPEYLGNQNNNFCRKEEILSQFKNIESYKKFIFDEAGYQRSRKLLEHLVFE